MKWFQNFLLFLLISNAVISQELPQKIRIDSTEYFFDEFYNTIYTKSASNEYYITYNNKKFYSLNKQFNIFKSKGLYGIEGVSDFGNESTKIILVNPKYSQIEYFNNGDKFLVKNDNNNYGLINSFGDTLIPLIYSKIEESPFLPDENIEFPDTLIKDKIYLVYFGKRKGIFSLKKGEIIPPIYAKIDYLYDQGFRVKGYLVHNYGKKGFYHPSGKEIAPCDFEILECLNLSSEYFKTMIGRKNGKWFSWKYDQLEQTIFKPINYTLSFNFIIEHFGYIKEEVDYTMYDLFTQSKTEHIPINQIEFKNQFYTIFHENGKCGIKTNDGKTIIQPNYEFIQFESVMKNQVRASQNGILYKIDLTNLKRIIEINDE